MGRVKKAGKRIMAWLMALCMMIGVMPPIEAKAAVSIAGADITFWDGDGEVDPNDYYTYNGSPITPTVQVRVDNQLLNPGTDYTLEYTNNTNSGTATVTVRGAGGYSNSCSKNFRINKVSLISLSVSFNDARVQDASGNKPYMFYDGGNALEPVMKVQGVRSGAFVDLTQNDYSISYTNNKLVSNTPATVTVTLKDDSNYSCPQASMTSNFYICYNLGSDDIVTNVGSMTYNGDVVVPSSLSVTDRGRGYELQQGVDYNLGNWTEKVKAGKTSISISAKTGSQYKGSKTFTYDIAPYDINSASVELINGPYYFTGTGSSKLDMTNNVQVKIGDFVVSKDDYTVSYLTGSNGNIGTNWLGVTGKNNLSGTREMEFEIVQGIGSAEIKNPSVEYDGDAVSLADLGLIVKDKAGSEMSSETDYVVEYYSDSACTEENKVTAPTQVGTYYLKIKSIGSYIGELSGADYMFSIIQQSFDQCRFTLRRGNEPSTDRELSRESILTVDYNKDGINLKVIKGVDAQGNELTIGADKDFTYGVYSDENCTKQDGITQENGFHISKAGTYYIQVVGTGKGNYTSGEQKFRFEVKPMQLVVGNGTVTIEDQIYTGFPIIPDKSDITVTFRDAGGNTFELDEEDFVIISEWAVNNVDIQNKNDGAPDAKIPSIQIELTGNYTLGMDETLTGTFSIVPRIIGNCRCNLVPGSSNYDSSKLTAEYNGQVQIPDIVILDGEKKLIEGTDYTVLYKDTDTGAPKAPQNVGKYTVTITGMGTYGGTVTATYEIKPKRIDGLILKIDSVPYNDGSAISVEVIYSKIKLTDGNTLLAKGTDYTIEGIYHDEQYTNKLDSAPKDAGIYYVKLTGTGNYAGEKRDSFYIGNDFTEQISSFNVSGWTYDVDETGKGVSYYNEIQAAIARKVKEQNPEMADKYQVYYFSDAEHSQQIYAGNPAFSSAGTVYFRVSGKNGYYGCVEGRAVIAKKKLADLKAEILGDYVYSEETAVTYYDNATQKGVKVYAYTSESPLIQQVLDTSAYTITNGDAYSNAGDYTITLVAAENSNYIGSKNVSYTIKPKEINSLSQLKVTIPSQEYTSEKLMPKVTLSYGNPGIALNASNYSIALYKDEAFQIPATDDDLTNVGSVYVKVTGRGNYTGYITSAEYGNDIGKVQGSNRFEITAKDIKDVTIDIEGKDYIYVQNKPLSFKVEQVFQRNTSSSYTVLLKKGQDYTYTEPDSTKSLLVGPQTITLTGKGNYKGTRSFQFNFAGDLSRSDHATITIGDENTTVTKPFTGTGVSLEDTEIKIVSQYNKQVLRNGTDYVVNYKDNIEPGKATVIFSGNNDQHWYGTVEQNFVIIGDLSTDYTQITIPDQVYTGSDYGTNTQPIQGMEVKFHGQVLVEGRDYEVSSVTNGKAVSDHGAEATITAVQGSYFTGSATAKFSIKYDSSKLNITMDKKEWDYNDGKAVEPSVIVSYPTRGEGDVSGGVTLEKGTDYTLEYHNNTEVGQANGIQGPYVEVKPTADGKITGSSAFVPFTINKIKMSECKIGGIADSYLYTGDMIKPKSLVVYKKDGSTVIDSSNYDVIYETNASNPTMAPAGCIETITIKGKGNYTGTVSKSFVIARRDLSDPNQAICTIEDQTYSAKALTPDVAVTILDENGEKKSLKAGTDYVVADYTNNIKAGEKNAAGAPYATINGVGSCNGNVKVTFTILKRKMDELVYSQVENPQYVPGQTEYCPEVSVYMSNTDEDTKLTAGRDYSITYYNNDEVCEQNGTSGPYIQFEPIDRNNYEGSHQICFSILAKDITSEDIKVTLADTADSGFDSATRNYVFDKDKTNYSPQPTVTFDNGSTNWKLTAADYTIDYESNLGIGTGYVVITGTGNYTGIRREAFTIGTLISNDTVTITGVSDKVYNGEDTTPTEIKVKFNAKNEYLKEQTADTPGDYTVGYYLDEACQIKASAANMQNAGRIYVGITGTADAQAGGYVGTAVVSYEITRKSLTAGDIEVRGNDDVDYTGDPVFPANLQLIDKTTGRVISSAYYTITYENNVEIGTASATITANDTGNYKDSITVYYRITKHSINNVVAEAIPDQKYTGGYIIPNLTLYDNGTRLVKGVDYEVVNGNNLRAGQSWVIIKGLGNYDQTKKVYFNIVASLETAIVDDIEDQLYTGNPVMPVERVACGGNTLVRGVDYTVSYANNTEVGDASITIRPLTQYYTGTIVKKFTITNSIAGATVTGIPASYLYTGEAFVPEPVVRFGGVTLTKNVDYTVVYRNNVNVGTASVIISGIGKYSGTKTVTFVITQKSMTTCTIYMVSSQNFTGKLITPPVVVKDGNRALTQGVDYVLSYSNNLDVGTGYITIAGRGDYQGTVTKEFKIVAEDPVENVLIQNKKEDAGTFDILIDGAAVYVDHIRVVVWSKDDKSDAYSYQALRVDGDTFIAYVNAGNHGYTSGTYQIAVYASGENYAEHEVFQTTTTFQPTAPGSDDNPASDDNPGQVVEIRIGVWRFSDQGWWYQYEDGDYVVNCWLELDGTWYYFDGSGYILTGWQRIGNDWYYFGNDGCMRTGWQQIDGIWYYMQDSGAMATGWQQIDDTWYYFNSDGAMVTGWQQIGGIWYYMKDSGAMVTGWIQSGNTWYYMKDSGAMATGWQQIGGTWYYMYGSGAMATNTWIGRDYVSASGAWTTSR